MAGGYRCSLGHAWNPQPGAASPTACPVCGDTIVIAAEAPAFVVSIAPDHPDPHGKDLTLPPDAFAPSDAVGSPTVTLPPTQFAALANEESSFSSLVGMPKVPNSRFAIDHGSVVPFGVAGGNGAALDFTPPPVPGYEILAEVGRGGMGVVYKARQVSLNRTVALKMILAGSHAGPVERDRFRREAEAVATLQNGHIVQIFEIGEANGHLYLALEFVEGGSLAQHIGGTPWPGRDAAALVELLARAVHYAHSQGVVHRDLKPGNILLGSAEDGRGKADEGGRKPNASSAFPLPPSAFRPKITDFGLAKRLGDTGNPDGTKTGAVMGTPSYIAPEQASGKARDVGPGADVYALGAILYELLTGRPPFLGETPLETVLQVINDDPVPPKRLQPGVARDLETICLKCLTKSIPKRYASADALADDLRRCLSGEAIKARPLSAWGRGVKWARRHPSLAVLGVVTALATVALVSVLSVSYAQVKDAVEQKESEFQAARAAEAKEADQRRRAEQLAADIELKRRELDRQNEELKREAERTRRVAFALQLAQVAAMCERDPRRASNLLDDEKKCPPDLRDFTWAYLRRMCQREDRVYAQHAAEDSLRAVAYSPTGTLVATAGTTGSVRVWDPRTGRTWAVLTGHAGAVHSVAFSPDGEIVATAGADRTVRLWELPVDMLDSARTIVPYLPGSVSGLLKPLTIADGLVLSHPEEVNAVAFRPDGHFLVTGDELGSLRWWDLRGAVVTNPSAAAAGGTGPAAWAVSHASRAPDARPIWEYHDRPIKAHTGGVKCLAFATSGKVLVSGGGDRKARVWPGSPDETAIQSIVDHADAVRAVAVAPNGQMIATVDNGETHTIRLVNVETGRVIRRLIGHTGVIHALAICGGDGEILASVGFDRSVRLWDVEDGKERGILLGHDLAVNGVAFAADRRTLVSVGSDATARVWHTTSRPNDSADIVRPPRDRSGGRVPVVLTLTAAAAAANGSVMIGGNESGRVQMLRADPYGWRPGAAPGSGPFVLFEVFSQQLQPRGRVRAAAATPDGARVMVSTDDGILIWRVLRFGGSPGGGPPLALNRPVALRVPRPVYAMAVDPTSRWLATIDAEGVRVWDLDSIPNIAPDRPDRKIEPRGPGFVLPVADARELSFHPSGGTLAVAVGKGIRVIGRDGKILADLPSAHGSQIEAIAFGGKGGRLLATADAAGLVKVWRVGNGYTLEHQTDLPGHTGPVYSVAFSPDGRTLASGGHDRTVLLWDAITGQERAVLTGHADQLQRVQFLPDGSALLTVARDGIVKRWRADIGRQSAVAGEPRTPGAAGG